MRVSHAAKTELPINTWGLTKSCIRPFVRARTTINATAKKYNLPL